MDPIAVDVSVKSPISLGLGSRPITTLNGSSRPEAKPEPAKPPFTAPTPVAVGPTTMPGKIAASLGFQPSRKNGLALAAAACSLVAGIAAVKYLAPTRPTEGTQPLVAEVVKKEEAAKAPETQKPVETQKSTDNRPAPVVEVQQSSFLPGGSVIPLAYPTAPPPSAPTSAYPVPPATPTYTATLAAPTYTVPPAIPSAVIPSTPPAVILSATLPTISTLPSAADGFVTAGSSKTGSAIPQPGELLPPSIAPPSIFPASASESPVVPPATPAVPFVPATLPSATPPLPMIPTMVPSTPTPVIPSTVPTTPTALPISPPASVVPPSTFPSTAPEMPKPLTIEYSKPAGSLDVKPAPTPDRTAVTSFDVDLHEPKNGDTYSTISKEFYNDVKYAGALQEYNGGRPLKTSVWVQVPPIHVLKKRYPQLIGSVVPASGKTGDVWGPSGEATPAFRATGQRTFTVPTGGMTMGSIARDTLGSPNRWQDLYAVNPSLSPGEVLPAGTVVKIPAEVKPNQ